MTGVSVGLDFAAVDDFGRFRRFGRFIFQRVRVRERERDTLLGTRRVSALYTMPVYTN